MGKKTKTRTIYILVGLSPFDTEKIEVLSHITRDKTVSCGKGIWAEDGEIVTPCPIAAEVYSAFTGKEIKTKKVLA